ncbi:MAG TPA: hypothetical protein VGN34_28815 [Ktedonobacteraceae bacterium]|jgi:NTP pyrophosphatase (non-canonical NTP hydrolase)
MGLLRVQQHEMREWRSKNFPGHTWEEQFIGVVEEVGELGHHLLKQKQGIRGTHSEHELGAKDAVGDIVIYLMGLCEARGWDLQDILEDTVSSVLKRDWQKDPQAGVTATPAVQSGSAIDLLRENDGDSDWEGR